MSFLVSQTVVVLVDIMFGFAFSSLFFFKNASPLGVPPDLQS